MPPGLEDGRQRRQLLGGGVAPGVLVGVDHRHLAAPGGHLRLYLDRHDLVGEAALVDGGHRPAVGVVRPGVLVLPGDAALPGRVLADGDAHVEVGRLG